MKKTFLLVPLAIILVMSLFLVSCEDEPEIKIYKVTFLKDKGDTTPYDEKIVLEGTGITEVPKEPTDDGRIFEYWKLIDGDTKYDLNTPIKSDLTLVAEWKAKKYTVSFMDGEGKAAEPQTVEYGKNAATPKTPEKDGYTFSCWRKVGSSSPFDFTKEVIKEDTVLEAVWDINTYTVTFKNADGTDYATKDVLYNGKVDKPEGAPTPKEGYSFKHWATSADSKSGYDFATPITNNLVLYPVFEINEYTVTFIGDEHISSVPDTQKVAYGNYAEDPNAKAKDGYVLNGWKTEGSEEYFDFETKITSDITLQAVISRDTTKAHVSFYDGEKLVASGYYNIGNIQEFPIYNNVGTGCTLTKWVLESNPEKEYLPGGGFIPVDYKTEYKFFAYITTDLLNIDESGAVKATDKLKNSETITSLSIPHSINGIAVKAIGNNAFLNCSNLTSITIPSSVTSIGSSPFKKCNKLTEINVSEENTNFESDNGVLIDVNNKKLICYPAAKSGDTYTVPNTVTTIADNAFFKCTYLTSITIPDSVTSIGQYAFYYFSKLTNITIPNSVTAIGQFAFYECSGLKSITIPSSVTSIGEKAFAYSGLKSITIPSSVKSFGQYAFAYSRLTNITIEEGVKSIGQYAFTSCSDLTSIAIPSSVTSIEKEAFRDCKNLTGLSFSGTNSLGIGYAAFMGCSGLKNIDFGNRYTTLGNDAFANCTSLTSVTIKGNLSGMGGQFTGCTALTSVEIKEGVKSIPDNVFKGCNSLKNVSLPNGLEIIFRNVFEGCSNLQSITLPNSVESIYSKAFAGTGLTSITIPNSVTYIDETAFNNCANLSKIKINKPEGSIDNAPWGATSSPTVTWNPAN